jgi:hypothetical protein
MIQPTFIIPTKTPAAPAAPPQQGPSYDELVSEYRHLRDFIASREDELKKQLAPLKERYQQIEATLLDELNRTGANSINTNSGTAYRTTRTSYGIDDPEAFRAWVAANNRPDFFENRPSKEALESWIEAGNPLPPGVKVSSFTKVNIRKS